MVIGVCKVVLHLPENHSLKGKRQVVQSIIHRVRHQFNVAIAEVDDNDRWQTASLGISCVSNNAQHADEMLQRVVDFIERSRMEANIADWHMEIIPAF
ncbi:MAG TPA: DUF503 domain-containing protein [Chloroflexota bacterium]|jgi:uncharacterized protein YlxP (DUF503 family)